MVSNHTFGCRRRKRKHNTAFLGMLLVFFYGLVSHSTRRGSGAVTTRFYSENLYRTNVRTDFISSAHIASVGLGNCITIFLTDESCPDATLSAFLENTELTKVQIIHARTQGSHLAAPTVGYRQRYSASGLVVRAQNVNYTLWALTWKAR